MIGRISGKLIEKNPPQILVDVGGVGYEIDVPMSTFYNLPEIGGQVVLLTHFLVREDAQLLYGFLTAAERSVFRMLIKISGIGARTALSILSGMTVQMLAQAAEALRPRASSAPTLKASALPRASTARPRATSFPRWSHWDTPSANPLPPPRSFPKTSLFPKASGRPYNPCLAKRVFPIPASWLSKLNALWPHPRPVQTKITSTERCGRSCFATMSGSLRCATSSKCSLPQPSSVGNRSITCSYSDLLGWVKRPLRTSLQTRWE